MEQRLLQDWCRQGDARTLGLLFDQLAPGLLRLAIHLVGDAATAEDLVQASFLALIEKRKTLDASRPIMPWLSGVLSHKAQQLRRERSRPLDVDRLHQRSVEAPSAGIEHEELSGELAKAIDGLGEPYRQVLLLRMRHGMELADIAHVLGRDPGTVSVQLHRGIERLRQTLPAALATSALVGLLAPRGLAAVKAQVLSQAGAAVAVAQWSSIVGGLFMGKKAIVAVCIVLIALLAFLLRSKDQAQEAHAGAEVAHAELAQSATGLVDLTQSAASREPLPESQVSTFTSMVVDAETGAPLANANIALFAGRETTPFELQRDHPDYYKAMGATMQSRTYGDWPRIVGADEIAFAGRRPLLSLDKPESGQKPLERTTSDSHGRFTLPAALQIGLIEVSCAGHATRWRPYVDGKAPISIALWREREASGEVIDERGARITEPLDLVLFASGDPPKDALERYELDAARLRITGDRTLDREGIELQRVTSASDGTFRATVGTLRGLHMDVLSLGWAWRGATRPELDSPTMVLQLARVPTIHFFDDQTKQPIERVRLHIRELVNGRVMSCNEVSAPGGMVTCPMTDDVFRGMSLEFTAWATGFALARWMSTDRSKSEVIEVPMHQGAAAQLRGRVLRDGKPVDGALVAVFGHRSRMWNAGHETRNLLDAMTTREGEFHFELPAGSYLVRVRDSGIEAFSVVKAPTETPFVIDLDHLARIEVEVVDQNLAPRPNHAVALQGGDSRTSRAETNADGIALFGQLPAGRYTVMAPNVSTHGSFSGDANQVIEIQAGQHGNVRLETIATMGPRHARIVAKGISDYTSWRARFSGYEWNDVAADGTIPMDLSTDAWRLDIQAPDGRGWRMLIPKLAADGMVIELDAGDARMEGELVDGTNPVVGVLITAEPRAKGISGGISASVVTDGQGRFALSGLVQGDYRLKFERRQQELPINFLPSSPASNAPTWMRIQLATSNEEVRWTGTLRDRSGKPRAGLMVNANASILQAAGVLRVAPDSSYTHTDVEGNYVLKLPRTPDLVLTVREAGGPTLLERELTDDGAAERKVDLTID